MLEQDMTFHKGLLYSLDYMQGFSLKIISYFFHKVNKMQIPEYLFFLTKTHPGVRAQLVECFQRAQSPGFNPQHHTNWVWCGDTPAIPAFGRMKAKAGGLEIQGHHQQHKFKANLGQLKRKTAQAVLPMKLLIQAESLVLLKEQFILNLLALYRAFSALACCVYNIITQTIYWYLFPISVFHVISPLNLCKFGRGGAHL